ncbi:Superfamily II DNA or RNA helicase [Mucilaginibacter gossypiicola]|uniref:Superfamily II DNA or RNA helicase n=1 Tax=Mucilaginibacter gossypiicola TaxID=551995 RepID=A0A1H8HNX4_9SPHI|nr:DEAD/DEAH box helicase family protein [Mucilaginibacter gossypiicola]SEN57799.1 Superfamily II DNA or RNA helicase [Mucilaginibacter gossypiicola]
MIIILPPVKSVKTNTNGQIVAMIKRKQEVESAVTKVGIDKKSGLEIKINGNPVLLLIKRNSQALKKQYTHIVVIDEINFNELPQTLDLSDLDWNKHPLLSEDYVKKHTKQLVTSSWKNNFNFKEDSPGSAGLRVPQIGSLHALKAHWCISNEAAVIVLPTGTGKTETMLSTLVLENIPSLLVVVPTDALRDQLAGKFATLGILPEFGIVNEDAENPIVGIMRHAFKTPAAVKQFIGEVNVTIATMSVLAACTNEIQTSIAGEITHLFIDEAHHTPAATWSVFKNKFSKQRVVLFTATPFRNDGKKLDGKFVFNFPLKKAQELDYFRPILFKPINEHNRKLADQQIAALSVETLAEDLNNGFDHILMVRVNKIERAEEILPYYASHTQFNPVIIHSQIKPASDLKQIVANVKLKKHRIIICVDMLGEGFDLPELKIAAFHDTKKSLAITLQLAGRFTRPRTDLGQATFIANLAEAEVTEDLEDLYYKDSDWNLLLPDMAYKMSLEQEDFRDFMEGFKGFPDKFPIQAIKNPLSVIIFKQESDKWNPLNYRKGLAGIDSFEYVYSDYNKEKEVLIVITGKRNAVKWAKVEDFQSINWEIIVCHFDQETKLLYLHASNTNSYYDRFVQAVGIDAFLLKGQNIFRVFYGLNRLRLHNVGVREPMGRAMNYIMRVGSDIKTALRSTEINKAIKSNIFGVGFENAGRTSVGCSHHGRVWSMRSNNIPTWIKWSKGVANKITDESIDADLVLKGTLLPEEITVIEDVLAFSIEWPDFIYRELIGSMEIIFKNEEYPVWNCDLSVVSQTSMSITFSIDFPVGKQLIVLELYHESNQNKYRFKSSSELFVRIGGERRLLKDFFEDYPPLIYFVNGSFLEGNLFTRITHILPKFPSERILTDNWIDTNIRLESQSYAKKTDSIQYNIIQMMKSNPKYQIIVDDDDSGEIGDVLGLYTDERSNILNLDIYHCKFSSDTSPGIRLKDFYEVCGQAQKSVKWMENTDEIFKHIIRRSQQRFARHAVDRFEKGNEDDLDILKRRARKDLKLRMHIFIVQPGLSKRQYTTESDVSKLLAVVETYLQETWNAGLTVISSI